MYYYMLQKNTQKITKIKININISSIILVPHDSRDHWFRR